jgi:hypothetical protein
MSGLSRARFCEANRGASPYSRRTRQCRHCLRANGSLPVKYKGDSHLEPPHLRSLTVCIPPRMGVPIHRPNIGGIARKGMMFTDYFPRRSTPLQRHADISRHSAGKVDDLGS